MTGVVGPSSRMGYLMRVYQEEWKGSIEVRKVADLVVVDLPDRGMLEQDPELCFSMRERVLLTLVDEEVRYSKAGGEI